MPGLPPVEVPPAPYPVILQEPEKDWFITCFRYVYCVMIIMSIMCLIALIVVGIFYPEKFNNNDDLM
uniref:Protein U24 n=1 Tax=Caenorhabditis tropicalis TaxID=1561998 RepID=A0A1I7UV90_9PELO